MNDFEKFVSEHDAILKSQIVDNESMGWKVFSNRFVAFLDISGFKVTTKYPYYSYSLLQAFKGIAFYASILTFLMNASYNIGTSIIFSN